MSSVKNPFGFCLANHGIYESQAKQAINQFHFELLLNVPISRHKIFQISPDPDFEVRPTAACIGDMVVNVTVRP